MISNVYCTEKSSYQYACKEQSGIVPRPYKGDRKVTTDVTV